MNAWEGAMTTLVVPVPEADGVVENWRMQYATGPPAPEGFALRGARLRRTPERCSPRNSSAPQRVC